MKKILIAAALMVTLGAKAQSPWFWKLKAPVYSFEDTGKYVYWYMLNYPQTTSAYWAVITDTTTRNVLKDGNVNIPASVINSWGTDDTVIPKWLEAQKIWAKKPE